MRQAVHVHSTCVPNVSGIYTFVSHIEEGLSVPVVAFKLLRVRIQEFMVHEISWMLCSLQSTCTYILD